MDKKFCSREIVERITSTMDKSIQTLYSFKEKGLDASVYIRIEPGFTFPSTIPIIIEGCISSKTECIEFVFPIKPPQCARCTAPYLDIEHRTATEKNKVIRVIRQNTVSLAENTIVGDMRPTPSPPSSETYRTIEHPNSNSNKIIRGRWEAESWWCNARSVMTNYRTSQTEDKIVNNLIKGGRDFSLREIIFSRSRYFPSNLLLTSFLRSVFDRLYFLVDSRDYRLVDSVLLPPSISRSSDCRFVLFPMCIFFAVSIE